MFHDWFIVRHFSWLQYFHDLYMQIHAEPFHQNVNDMRIFNCLILIMIAIVSLNVYMEMSEKIKIKKHIKEVWIRIDQYRIFNQDCNTFTTFTYMHYLCKNKLIKKAQNVKDTWLLHSQNFIINATLSCIIAYIFYSHI